MDLLHWRARNHEVDFIVHHGSKIMAVEVKSGRNKGVLAGLNTFVSGFFDATRLVVGSGGIPLERFLSTPVEAWI